MPKRQTLGPWRRLALTAVAACMLGACTMMPPQEERMRVHRIEGAVLPMADAALDAGQTDAAERLYVRLLEVNPDSSEARIGLGDVHLAKGEAKRAAAWYSEAVDHAQTPTDRHAALLAHGRAALASGSADAARVSFALLVDPEEDASDEDAAWGFNGIGVLHLLEGRPDEAVAAFDTAVRRHPREAKLRENLERAAKMAAARRELEQDAAAMADPPSVDPRHTALEPQAVPVTVEADPAAPHLQAPSVPAATAVPAEEPSRSATAAQASTDARPLEPAEPLRPQSVGDEPASDGDSAPAGVATVSDPLPKAFVVRSNGARHVQVGAYTVPAHADAMAARLRAETDLPVRIDACARDGEPLSCVRFGPVPPSGLADELAEALGIDNGAFADGGLDAGGGYGAETPLRIVSGGSTYLQVGAYADRDSAMAVADEARMEATHPVDVQEVERDDGKPLYRVRIGPLEPGTPAGEAASPEPEPRAD